MAMLLDEKVVRGKVVIESPMITVNEAHLPSVKLRQNATWFVMAVVFYGVVCGYMQFDPLMMVTEFDHVVNLANEMAPPNVSLLWASSSLYVTTYATVSMAFLGTLLGGIFALVLSFFAAQNVMPFASVRSVTRLSMVLQRVTPTIIVLLVLQTVFGVGPFSGMVSIAIGSFGMFGKLFADSVEQVDQGPLDGMACVGATRSQIVRYGILPEVLPSFIANMFYAFDINMRTAIGLGMFGGGGLGYELYKAGRTLNYKDQLALILVIVVMISLMERVSDYLRGKVMHGGQMK
ncbi:MAG: PhnE/PtxC family ABC transporter permease [Candidatus Latescibacterota bacterium]